MNKQHRSMDHHLIKGLVTNEECREIIKIADEIGYEDSPVYIPATGEYVMNIKKRLSRFTYIPITEPIKEIVLRLLDRTDLIDKRVKLASRPRVIRYDDGGYFRLHRDMVHKREIGGVDYEGRYNMLIYLNDDYTDGRTIFFGDDMTFTPIDSEKGDVLLFYPKIKHCGDRVKGTKIILSAQLMIPHQSPSKSQPPSISIKPVSSSSK